MKEHLASNRWVTATDFEINDTKKETLPANVRDATLPAPRGANSTDLVNSLGAAHSKYSPSLVSKLALRLPRSLCPSSWRQSHE